MLPGELEPCTGCSVGKGLRMATYPCDDLSQREEERGVDRGITTTW